MQPSPFSKLTLLSFVFVSNSIAGVAKILEDNQKLLAFTHFSLECDNLERVFLDLCSKEDTEKPVHDINGEKLTFSSYRAKGSKQYS